MLLCEVKINLSVGGDCMQFIRRDDSMQHSCIYLDMGNIELGMREGLGVTEFLTQEEYDEFKKNYEVFKYFRVDTYNVLKPTNSSYNWGYVFDPVNKFLSTLSEDEQRLIGETFIMVHYEIISRMQYDSNFTLNLVEITNDISDILDKLDIELDLCGKLEIYVNDPNNIEIPLFENAGKRAQDTDDMTFYRPEVVILTLISILNKLFSPILGVFIEHCKKQIDNSLKELHCVNIILPLLERRFPAVIQHLKWFIRKIIKNNVKNTVEYVANGFTLELEAQKNFANILVRKLVCVNLFCEGGNLMIYITTSIRESTRTPTFLSVTRGAIKEMETYNESSTATTGDDGNTSILEFGSRCSDHTVDYPVLISVSAKSLVENMIKQEELNIDIFNECVNYYNFNLINITPINTFLLATTYGYQLGGAKAIWALNARHINELVVLFQLQCLKRGYNSLIPLVSVGSPIHLGLPEIKVIPTQSDNQLKTAWNASFEYRNCKNRFELSVGNLEWDTIIKEIVNYLINTNLAINLPFYMLEQLKIEKLENTEYQYPDQIIKNICGYILDITVGTFGGESDI